MSDRYAPSIPRHTRGVLAMLLLVGAAASAHATPPSPPPPSTLDSLLASIALADGVVVEHPLGGVRQQVDGHDVTRGRSLNRARMGRDWAMRFTRTLGGGAYHALAPSEALAWRPDSLAGRERLRIRPVGTRGAVVDVIPSERAAILSVDGRPRAYVEVASVLAGLFALAGEALPRDPWVRQQAWSAQVPPGELQRLPLEELPPPDGDRLPGFGDYVYVEELPVAITRPAPEYAPAARRARIEGTVLVQALVGKDGIVKDTRIVSSVPALDDAAVASIRQWRFKPALSKGRPVAVWVSVPIRFTLDGGGR